jgi:hypothetical protein
MSFIKFIIKFIEMNTDTLQNGATFCTYHPVTYHFLYNEIKTTIKQSHCMSIIECSYNNYPSLRLTEDYYHYSTFHADDPLFQNASLVFHQPLISA